MIDNIKIEPLTNERIKDVQSLMQLSLNRFVPLKVLEHKYNGNLYCEHKHIALLAYLEGKAIGFYGIIPMVYMRNEKQILVGQTCDSYTHPEYQGRGLHKALAEETYRRIISLGFKGVWAFHSENTYHSCKKLDWEVYDNFKRYEINVSGLGSFRIYSKFPFLSKLKSKRIERVLNSFVEVDRFPIEKNEGQNWFHLNSDNYIAYKNNFYCRILKIQDCFVWIRFDYALHIGAISNLTEDNATLVINQLKSLAKSIGSKKIIIQLNPKHPACKILEKRVEAKESFIVGYKNFSSDFDIKNLNIEYIHMDAVL